jgi:hypothetical protein
VGLDDVDALHAELIPEAGKWRETPPHLEFPDAIIGKLVQTPRSQPDPTACYARGARRTVAQDAIGAMTVYIKSVWLQVKMAGPSVRPIGWAAAALDSPLEQAGFELAVPP